MYIKTNTQYTIFENDKLTDLLSKINFKINNFGIWRSDCDTKASYVSNDIEIAYYIEGGSTTIISNKQYQCVPHSILILDPYMLHTSINQGYENYSYYYFHFDIEPYYLKDQFMSLLKKNGNVIYPHEIRNFDEMLKRLLKEAQNKEIGYSSVITSALIRILVEIIRVQLKRNEDTHFKPIHSPYIQLVNDTIIYIQKHLYEPLRVKELSSIMGVSSSMLYKAFMNVLEISPIHYIQQQKIRHAQSELTLGKSVNEISQELGYSSAYHLSKAFKNIMGMSPREYKKNNIKNKNMY